MCCCDKPTINGELGYKWNNPEGPAGIRPIHAPDIQEGDTILFDEPGRCGGIDSHCHHYRLITARYGGVSLLVHHGGGDERIHYLSNDKALVKALHLLDSNGRYWILNALYHAQKSAERKAQEATEATWRKAAAEKRIKTRKYPARGTVKVWIEEKRETA